MPPPSITTVMPVTTSENSPSWRVDSCRELSLKKPGMTEPNTPSVATRSRKGMALSVQRLVRISPTRWSGTRLYRQACKRSRRVIGCFCHSAGGKQEQVANGKEVAETIGHLTDAFGRRGLLRR